jgi:transcriptional regulator with XRE-family HTH domain
LARVLHIHGDAEKARGVCLSGNATDVRIGERLRARREAGHLTRAALAKAAGVDARRLALYESGAASAPVSALVRLARALEISPAVLFEDGGWAEALNDLARAGAEGSLELVQAFAALPDGDTRRAFLNLAWTMVEAQKSQQGE